MAEKTTTRWELAPAPESSSHAQINDHYGLFIDGRFVSSTGKKFETLNPATEKPLSKITESTIG